MDVIQFHRIFISMDLERNQRQSIKISPATNCASVILANIMLICPPKKKIPSSNQPLEQKSLRFQKLKQRNLTFSYSMIKIIMYSGEKQKTEKVRQKTHA